MINLNSTSRPARRLRPFTACLFLGLLISGCSTAYYRKSADKEVYKIVQGKQQTALGHTNEFTIDTRYSSRDPYDVKAPEIVQDRDREEKQKLTLPEALLMGVQNSPQYQLRKENLYISGLNLTRERYNYRPQFFGRSTATYDRLSNGERSGRVNSDFGLDQALKTGGSIGLAIANDLLRFYTGDPRRSAVSTFSATLFQPLLRGAGADIATENLTQAERNVIYEIRDFSYYQSTFAVSIVTTYLTLLQQQDVVRNEYDNYLSLVRVRERAEALGVDRMAALEVDQARQQELSARSRYIIAVERYQQSMDQFNITLGLPLGYQLNLDESAMKEVDTLGLLQVPLSEKEAYGLALTNRLDLINQIDAFEDIQRKIKVAANRLKTDLNIVSSASLESDRPTDYAQFDINDYRASVGLQLDLPIDRLLERNAYRSSLLAFERQIRTLALFLDDVRDSIRQGLRSLEQARQNYQIQTVARDLAVRRVENMEILQQAGQAIIRDVLDAQSDLLSANNAVTLTLLNYHITRLRLVLDVGIIKTDEEKFWLKDQVAVYKPAAGATDVPAQTGASTDLISPDKLFEK